MASYLEIGFRLLNQAVSQDYSCNYSEAARCYEESIKYFYKASATYPSFKIPLVLKTNQIADRLRHINSVMVSVPLPVDSDRGTELLRLARCYDSKNEFKKALPLYEEAEKEMSKDGTSSRTTILHVHDRKEAIREHLEKYAPISIRKQIWNSINNVEDEMFESDEFNALSEVQEFVPEMSESVHSLYPTCEITRTTSVSSNISDIQIRRIPPLANLDPELRLSTLSIVEDPEEEISSLLNSNSEEIVVLGKDRTDASSDSGISDGVKSPSTRSRNSRLSVISSVAVASKRLSVDDTPEKRKIKSREIDNDSEDDGHIPEGCFYFLSCLDAFGIL